MTQVFLKFSLQLNTDPGKSSFSRELELDWSFYWRRIILVPPFSSGCLAEKNLILRYYRTGAAKACGKFRPLDLIPQPF